MVCFLSLHMVFSCKTRERKRVPREIKSQMGAGSFPSKKIQIVLYEIKEDGSEGSATEKKLYSYRVGSENQGLEKVNIDEELLEIVRASGLTLAYIDSNMLAKDQKNDDLVRAGCYYAAYDKSTDHFFLDAHDEIEPTIEILLDRSLDLDVEFSGLLCINEDHLVNRIASNSYFVSNMEGRGQILRHLQSLVVDLQEIPEGSPDFNFSQAPSLSLGGPSLSGLFNRLPSMIRRRANTFRSTQAVQGVVKPLPRYEGGGKLQRQKLSKRVKPESLIQNQDFYSSVDELLKIPSDNKTKESIFSWAGEKAGNSIKLGDNEIKIIKLKGLGTTSSFWEIEIDGVPFALRVSRKGNVESSPIVDQLRNDSLFYLKNYGCKEKICIEELAEGDLLRDEILMDESNKDSIVRNMMGALKSLSEKANDGDSPLTHGDIKLANFVERGPGGKVALIDLDGVRSINDQTLTGFSMDEVDGRRLQREAYSLKSVDILSRNPFAKINQDGEMVKCCSFSIKEDGSTEIKKSENLKDEDKKLFQVDGIFTSGDRIDQQWQKSLQRQVEELGPEPKWGQETDIYSLGMSILFLKSRRQSLTGFLDKLNALINSRFRKTYNEDMLPLVPRIEIIKKKYIEAKTKFSKLYNEIPPKGMTAYQNYSLRYQEALSEVTEAKNDFRNLLSNYRDLRKIEIENKNGADPVTNELKPEDLDLILKMTDPDTSKRLTIEGSLSEWDTVHPPRAERAAAGVFGD